MKVKNLVIMGIVLVSIGGLTGCAKDNKSSEVRVFEKQNGVVETKIGQESNLSSKVVDVSFNYINEDLSYAVIWGIDSNGKEVWRYETKKDYEAQYKNASYIGTRGENVYISELGIFKILDLQTGKVKTVYGEDSKVNTTFWGCNKVFDNNNLYIVSDDLDLFVVDIKGKIKEIKLDLPENICGERGDMPWQMICEKGKLIMLYETIEQSSEYKEGYNKVETADSVIYEKIETLEVTVNLRDYKVTKENLGKSQFN